MCGRLGGEHPTNPWYIVGRHPSLWSAAQDLRAHSGVPPLHFSFLLSHKECEGQFTQSIRKKVIPKNECVFSQVGSSGSLATQVDIDSQMVMLSRMSGGEGP